MIRLVLCLGFLASLIVAGSAHARPEHGGEARLVAATFRSSWCGPCLILEPRINAVAPRFAEAPVEFIRFDLSFGPRQTLARRASAEGIGPIYQAHRDTTGYMLLIDRETGDILARITQAHSEAEISTALRRALQITEGRDEFGF